MFKEELLQPKLYPDEVFSEVLARPSTTEIDCDTGEGLRHMAPLIKRHHRFVEQMIAECLQSHDLLNEDRILEDIVMMLSYKGDTQQPKHCDYNAKEIARLDDGRVPLSVLWAIEDNSKLILFGRGGTKVVLPIPKGKMVVFRGDLGHAGAGYKQRNVRIHCYVSMKDERLRLENTTYYMHQCFFVPRSEREARGRMDAAGEECECENECGFEHEDKAVTEEHERNCTAGTVTRQRSKSTHQQVRAGVVACIATQPGEDPEEISKLEPEGDERETEDDQEVSMLSAKSPEFQRWLNQGGDVQSFWVDVDEGHTGCRDRAIMCANEEDFEWARKLPFKENAGLSTRHQALVQQAAMLPEFGALLVVVTRRNEAIAERVRKGDHRLLPCYVSEWYDAWLLLPAKCWLEGPTKMATSCTEVQIL